MTSASVAEPEVAAAWCSASFEAVEGERWPRRASPPLRRTGGSHTDRTSSHGGSQSSALRSVLGGRARRFVADRHSTDELVK